MLEVSGVGVTYGGVQALRGVSVSVAEGGIVALIGPNGAGKTTLLNAICGSVRPGAGRVVFDGRDITGTPAHRVARIGLLHVPEGRQILGPLSERENLELGRLALGRRGNAGPDPLARIFALFPILEKRQSQAGGSLSGGEQQMLAIGRAMMGRPRLLLLDEPSLGLSPLITGQVFEALRQLNAEGLTILLVEQNARRALGITGHAYVIEQGRIVQSGRSADLLDDPDVIAHYLGQGGRAKPKMEERL